MRISGGRWEAGESAGVCGDEERRCRRECHCAGDEICVAPKKVDLLRSSSSMSESDDDD